MTPRPPPGWPTDGDEPDPRYSLANERTLLAYERTALGLLVAGLAAAGSGEVAGVPLWFSIFGLPLIILGGVVGLAGRRRFLTAQAALRTGAPLGPPTVAMVLPWGIAAMAAAGIVAAVAALA